jgi:DNA-binding LacI/PurR family transcriptional regulator
MKQKRTTIYDIAEALDIHPSYVSKALNKHPSISPQMVEKVRSKAGELNYKHNSFAANLRTGRSKICGVIVPKINESFFANAIAGMEEVCAKNGHHIIICQTQESYKKEVEAVDMLIKQDVDCIIISLSSETKNSAHLQEVIANGITLIQFDRFDDSILSFIVRNDNREATANAVEHLLSQGYKKIAYIGGPEHLKIYADRKQGFIDSVREARLSIPYEYTCNSTLELEPAEQIASQLLKSANPPDAFVTASDLAALGAMRAARALNISIPQSLGIIGFQNEQFTSYLTPTLSSINQKSIDLGRIAAKLYFNGLKNPIGQTKHLTHTVQCELVINESSSRKRLSKAR